MEDWEPVGCPLETARAEQLCTQHSFASTRITQINFFLKGLQKEVKKLEGASPQKNRRSAPRGRVYSKWKKGLTDFEVRLLHERGFQVTVAEPKHISQMKEIVRASRNLESAVNSRARTKENICR